MEKMRRVILLVLMMTVFCSEFGEVSTQSSEFWIRAKETKQLSDLRVTPRAPKPTVNDSMIASPLFMPLCGNGRIDTRADYQQYYANSSNKPLTLTKQQINRANIVPVHKEPNKLYNISFMEDEECDDGNRLDFDGCSADCMYMDLWAPACEIAVDKSLQYEDLIYDTVRQKMVVSASDGIYTLEIAPGDSQMTSRLLAAKRFPVTSIFRHSGALILYSAVQQAFWQLRDSESEISHLRDLPNMTKWDPSSSLGAEWRVMLPLSSQTDDGPIIVRDRTALLYLTSPNASNPFYCMAEAQIRDKKCLYFTQEDNASLLGCMNDRVSIGPDTCKPTSYSFDISYQDRGNIWVDIMNYVTTTTAFYIFIFKNGNGNGMRFTPEMADQPTSLAVQMYHPLGGILETTLNPSRQMGSAVGTILSPIMYVKGDESLASMIEMRGESGICEEDRCIFDNDLHYDAMEKNPLKNAVGTTWNDMLQAKLNTVSPSISNLSALKSDAVRYRNFLNSFAQVYDQITAPLAVLTMLKHPENHNLWAIRKDKLIEVSKSGALLSRPDGKCIPSGIALCSPCYWAPNGQQCRPCSERDDGSWAWSVSCPASCATGRRLLLNLVVEGERTIQFALKPGNLSMIRSSWPTATDTNAEGLISVSVVTTDVVGEMRRIKLRLLGDTTVVIPPYVVIPVTIKTPDNTAGRNNNNDDGRAITTDDNTASSTPSVTTILTLSLVLVGLILIIIFALLYNSRHVKATLQVGGGRRGRYQHMMMG